MSATGTWSALEIKEAFKVRLLDSAEVVEFAAIVEAIERFNGAGLKPFGPNVQVAACSCIPDAQISFENEAGAR